MGDPACGLLEAELALDRLDAELAAELPAHVRAFAGAYAAGAPTPPAPPAARRPAGVAALRRALVHPELEDRAVPLLATIAPIAIEDDPRVVAARTRERTWPGYDELAAARDAAARERFGMPFLALAHGLLGVDPAPAPVAAPWPDPIEGWHAPAGGAGLDVERAWRAIADRHGARGTCRLVRAEVRPRAFVVEPGREVIVVIPGALDAPVARFAALHELGHAVAALVGAGDPAGARALPRVVDEAAAAYVARLLEDAGALAPGWYAPQAAAARARRTRLAAALDAIERGGGERGGGERGGGERRVARPPWALWHDPGAQAAYVAAEAIATRWWDELGPAPGPGALAAAIASEAARGPRRFRSA